MNEELVREYVSSARFDYIKLRWRYAPLEFCEEVRETVLAEFVKLQASVQPAVLKDPKFITLPPSPNKPDGVYLVELYGLAAELVKGLPANWLQYVTYAHVKSFAEGMTYSALQELSDLYVKRNARRSATIINPGTAGRSKKGQTANPLRIGSRKSDWHGVIYARKGFLPGFEGRFRDEGVSMRTLAALDFWDNGAVPDAAAWGHFLKSLARESADCFATDAMQRGIDLGEYVGQFGAWGRTDLGQIGLPIQGLDEVVAPPAFDGSEYAGPDAPEDFEAF